MAESWKGQAWVASEAPVLYDESFTSATDCMVAGTTPDGDNQTSLIEIWNGSQWTVSPTPTPTSAPQAGFLSGRYFTLRGTNPC